MRKFDGFGPAEVAHQEHVSKKVGHEQIDDLVGERQEEKKVAAPLGSGAFQMLKIEQEQGQRA